MTNNTPLSIAEAGPDAPVTDALFWDEWLGDDVDTPTVLEEAELAALKHLPGKHDQQRHAGTRGRGVAVGFSDKPVDAAESERLARSCDARRKECFRNAIMSAAMVGEGAQYVEGYVMDTELNFPFHHGWVETNDSIVDPTLILLGDDMSRYKYIPGKRYSAEEALGLAEDRTLPFAEGYSPEMRGAIEVAMQYVTGPDVELKHQPGRHDQQRHAGKRARAAGDRTAQLADPDSDINKDARKNWKNLSHEERMALMDPAAVDMAMDKELGRYRKEYDRPHDLEGKELSKETYDDIAANAHAHIDSLSDALNPTTERMLRDYVDTHTRQAVEAGLKDGSIKADAGTIDNLMRKNVDKLVYQEIESRKRQLGDHGIRHVLGNVEMANQMLDDPDLPQTSGLDRLMVAQAMVDHDMGYTAGVVTKSFEATKYHPQYSEKYAKAQGYEKVFGDKAKDLHHMVATHSSTDVDWEGKPVLSAVRTADNISLFSKEKLPALFNDVPGAETELYKLQLARVDGTAKDRLPKTKDNLNKLIDGSDLDPRHKTELHMAVDEVGVLTPKFTVGMGAGKIDNFDYKDGVMNVAIKSKPEREALNGLFDLGDAQYGKFLGDYDTNGVPSSNDGMTLLDKKTGKPVYNFKYAEAKAPVSGDLGRLYAASVRPTIRRADRQLGMASTLSDRERAWPMIEANLKKGGQLNAGEMAAFERSFMAGTLDQFPLTEKEQTFLTGERLKELGLGSIAQLAGFVAKHLPGKHDQQRHTPKRYGRGGGPVGLKPDPDRQARFRAILDDPELSAYHKDKAIRDELESMPGGPEALRQLEKWYYNPGNPYDAVFDERAYEEYRAEGHSEEDYPFEDWVWDKSKEYGWEEDADTALLGTLETVKDGTATPEQVDAMSAIYDYTQAHIGHRGISSVPVHRGLALEPYEVEDLKPGNKVGTAIAGHWTARKDVSEKFAAQVYESVPPDVDIQEVVIHKTFEPADVFDYHLAGATKFDKYHELNEFEVVPIDGTEHIIIRTEMQPSWYTGEEVLHIWVE